MTRAHGGYGKGTKRGNSGSSKCYNRDRGVLVSRMGSTKVFAATFGESRKSSTSSSSRQRFILSLDFRSLVDNTITIPVSPSFK